MDALVKFKKEKPTAKTHVTYKTAKEASDAKYAGLNELIKKLDLKVTIEK